MARQDFWGREPWEEEGRSLRSCGEKQDELAAVEKKAPPCGRA